MYCSQNGGKLESRFVRNMYEDEVPGPGTSYDDDHIKLVIIPYEDVKCFQVLMSSTMSLGCFCSDARFNPFTHAMGMQRTLARSPLRAALDKIYLLFFSHLIFFLNLSRFFSKEDFFPSRLLT